MLGLTTNESGGSMLRSKILLGIVAVIPAGLLVTSHSSLGAATGGECRLKPDGSAPPGLHWYYRVDRINNRHCWYLHTQGMAVHAPLNPTLRDRDIRNDTADEDAPKPPPGAVTPQPMFEQSDTTKRQTNFTSRWVDLPKSVDLNAPEIVAASSGYAPEQDVPSRGEHLPAAWPNVSVVNGQAQPNSPAGTNYFGSISLVGAAVLALLLISEALLRLVRRSAWTLLHRQLRAAPHPRSDSEFVSEQLRQSANSRMASAEPVFRAQTEADELRHLLQRAGDGLKPPRSFAPSRSMQHHDQSGRGHGHSALQRLKSRSFSGMTWAPL